MLTIVGDGGLISKLDFQPTSAGDFVEEQRDVRLISNSPMTLVWNINIIYMARGMIWMNPTHRRR